MKYKQCFVLCLVALAFLPTAHAQTTGNQENNEASDLILEYALENVLAYMHQGKVDQERLVIIYNILKNTNENYIHKQRGHLGNKVYLHKDGHKEAVYDEEGNLVKDGMNDGSFNFFHPYEKPLRHFLSDIHPWIMWGQSREDPTSVDERIFSYVSDFEGGLRRAHAERNALDTGDYSDTAQLAALAFFMKIIELGEAEEIFTIFTASADLTDESILRILRGVHRGLNIVYQDDYARE